MKRQPAKIQKFLDYTKAKSIDFPRIAQIKYDGHYSVIKVVDKKPTFYTSGGLTYKHNDDNWRIFYGVKPGYYLAERVSIKYRGKLGDRKFCALFGSANDKRVVNQTYKVFDYLTIEEYENGKANTPYLKRLEILKNSGIHPMYIVKSKTVYSIDEMEELAQEVAKNGYEGLVLKKFNWLWEDTKSRRRDVIKYKLRPSADLLCIDVKPGKGKYRGKIGALILIDKYGRTVEVGSGLTDMERNLPPEYFIGKVVEIEYEQIMDTYVQPVFITIREDKTEEDID